MYSMDPAPHAYTQYPVPLAGFDQNLLSPTGFDQNLLSPTGCPLDLRANIETNSPTWPSIDEYREAVATLTKMKYRVSDRGFYIPSPAFTSSNVFTFDNVPDIKPTPVSPTEPAWPPATRSIPQPHSRSRLSSCRIKDDNCTTRPFLLHAVPQPPRISCMEQATAIGEMLLGDGDCQSSPTFYSPSQGSGTIAGDILLEDVEFGYIDVPDLSPTMSVGLSENLFDAIDYIDVNPTYRFTELREISINEQESVRPVTLRCNPVDKKGHGKHCCDICKKSFKSRANLRQHIRVHTGEKPYECQVCSKRFTHSSSLRTHHRIHTGERPYSCPVCSRAFSDYSTWRKHCRLHSGERPYVCETCGKGFAQSGNLIRHRLTHQKTAPVVKLERI